VTPPAVIQTSSSLPSAWPTSTHLAVMADRDEVGSAEERNRSAARRPARRGRSRCEAGAKTPVETGRLVFGQRRILRLYVTHEDGPVKGGA
jgi:hypothetical protein